MDRYNIFMRAGAGRARLAWLGAPVLACAVMQAPCAIAGDFNGDGIDDAVICTPLEDIGAAAVLNAGAVTIIYGAPPGLAATAAGGAVLPPTYIHQNAVGVPDACEPGDQFGRSVAVGDFNGDGFDDLAVGVPNENFGGMADPGIVQVFYGTPGGIALGINFTLTSAGLGVPPTAGAQFGFSLASGDFNGDGLADLAIGAPYDDFMGPVDAGVVFQAMGAPGIGFVPVPFIVQPMLADPAEPGDQFGYSLAAGNFDGDPFDDLAIGVPYEDLGGINEGMIHSIMGTPGGLVFPGPLPVAVQGMFGDPMEPGDLFGFALAADDIDLSGSDDLVITVPGEDLAFVNGGAIVVLAGTPGVGLLPGGPFMFIPQGFFGVGMFEGGDFWGDAVAMGDFNGDGFADIAVGAPRENLGAFADAGEVTIIPGGPGGPGSGPPVTLWNQDTGGVLEAGAAFDFFGGALAAGDFDADGFDDLLIGAAGEDVLGGAAGVDAGGVHAIYGSPVGIIPAGNQWWHQSSPGVPDALEPGDAQGNPVK